MILRKRGLRAAPLVLFMHGLGAAPLVYLISSLDASPACAQGSSVLTGKVIDASTKQPAADVVVTATSPALQGEQTVVTDGSGSFRIPNLPPGDYTLRMDKETYRPYSRGGIGVRVGATIFIPAELLPEKVTIKEEIEVVGKAPTVDVGSAQQGTSVTADFTSRIPIARPSGKGGSVRSFESVAEVAPGASSDRYGVSIAGTTSPENAYVIDGVRTNDTAYGTAGTPLSIEFVKEVSVISGGYLPEYGRATGGVIEAATKSGSNQFTGSVFFNISPGAFEGPRALIKSEGQAITTDTSVGNIRDFGFDLGGPILKDKLWFYTGLDIAFTTYKLDRNLHKIRFSCAPFLPAGDPNAGQPDPSCQPDVDPETGFTITDPIDGTQRIYSAEEQSFQYIGKLSFAINQDNNLSLTITGTPRFSGGDGTFAIGPRTGLPEVSNINGPLSALSHRYTSITNDIALKYSTAFNQKKLLIDATVAWHHQDDGSSLPSDGSEPGTSEGLAGLPAVGYRRSSSWTYADAVTGDPVATGIPRYHSINDFESLPDPSVCDPAGAPVARLCPVRLYTTGGPGGSFVRKLDRYEARMMMTNFFEALGHHVVKSGLDFEYMGYGLLKTRSGVAGYRENTSGTSFSESEYGLLVGPDDAVAFPSVKTTTASVAFSAFVQDSWSILDKVALNAGVRMDNQWIYNAQGGLGLALPNQWSPRVGAIWDPTQAGRAKIVANYARYYESVPLDMADRSLSGETAVFSNHNAAICNPSIPMQQQNECRLNASRRILGGSTTPDQVWTPIGAGKTPVDPNIAPQSSDELVIGGELEVFANASVGLSYTKRWMNEVIEDMSRDEAATYFLGNPGSGIAADFPKAKRDYDQGTITFTKRFADQWQVIASYTLSYLRGNYAGLYRPETGQLDPNINSDFDLISLLDNRDGPLAGDTTHSIKVFGSKDFTFFKTWDLNLGLGFRAASGGPTNYTGSHLIYGSNEVFILPRGCGERLPWTFSIDPHIGFGYRLAKDSVVTLSMDIFNVFNFQAPTGIDGSYTAEFVLPISDPNVTKLCDEGATKEEKAAAINANIKRSDPTDTTPITTNPNYGNPNAYQSPRTFRFGAKVTF